MYISDENELHNTYWQQFVPFIRAEMLAEHIDTVAGINLHYRLAIPDGAEELIVIMQGRAESSIKYAELCFELYQNGYAVMIFDHQGQGQSSRLSDNPHIGFVNRYEDYIEDACHLIDTVCRDHSLHQMNKYLLAHSMGGAIGTAVLIERPDLFKKALIFAPMYGIQTPIPKFLAKVIARTGVFFDKALGKHSSYLLGHSNFQNKAFEENELSSSEIRYQFFMDTHTRFEELQLGGISYQWLNQAFALMEFIAKNAKRISTQCLVFSAGDELVVNNNDIERVVSDIPNANLFEISGAKHEILFEKDKYRRVALDKMYAFLQQNSFK